LARNELEWKSWYNKTSAGLSGWQGDDGSWPKWRRKKADTYSVYGGPAYNTAIIVFALSLPKQKVFYLHD
jgi:hypothetical protein